MSQRITIDYTNCMDTVIKRDGISKNKLKSQQAALRQAQQEISRKKKAGQLGFMELPYKKEEAVKIKKLVAELKSKFDNFVVLGIGGSALGNICLQNSLNHLYYNFLPKDKRRGFPRIFVLDNVDADMVKGLMEVIDVKKTIFNVITKSGATSETIAQYFIFRRELEKQLGKKYNQNIIATTDAEKGYLRELANKESYASLVVPKNVGGRFSVLSPVGLLSAAFGGIDIEKLLAGARDMDERCSISIMSHNPAMMYAVIQYLMYQEGKIISVMMPYAQHLKEVADWYAQLWAESLGKAVNNQGKQINVGPTPVKTLGATDQHSQAQLYMEGPFDKVVTILSVGKLAASLTIPAYDDHFLGGQTMNKLLQTEEKATAMALAQKDRPNLTITLPEINEFTMGQLIHLFELATAYMGELLEINTFDQPGVELGKILTYALMGRQGFEDKKKEIEANLKKMKSHYKV
ncbi:MAG: glucose-6-phosphate isomerase [Elusimicrobia bacterium]|nr:glucose-6-phosphate isomerase [Elusimicrobiota bacterium]